MCSRLSVTNVSRRYCASSTCVAIPDCGPKVKQRYNRRAGTVITTAWSGLLIWLLAHFLLLVCSNLLITATDQRLSAAKNPPLLNPEYEPSLRSTNIGHRISGFRYLALHTMPWTSANNGFDCPMSVRNDEISRFESAYAQGD